MQTIASRIIKTALPKGTHYRKILLGPAAGCVMAINFKGHLKTYLGLYEYELLPHMKRMVGQGTNCFDIGGKDGYDALMMANLSKGKVASFECEPPAAQQMRQTFAKNPGLSLQVIEAYVGAKVGPGYMTIDQAARELFVPKFIKLDIEGAEDEALKGAAETLAKHRPNIIIEVHGEDKENNCLTILRRAAYNLVIVDQGTLIKEPSRRGHNRWIVAYPTAG
jgi:hypothetical protein